MRLYIFSIIFLFTILMLSCRLATDTSEAYNLETDTYKINDDLAQRAAQDILALESQHGGATYHLEDGNLLGTKAYAVAVYPERSVTITTPLTAENIKNFIVTNQDLLNKGWHAIGVWQDKKTNHIVLDVVSTPTDRNAAIRIGQLARQEYILDLSNSNLVETGYK